MNITEKIIADMMADLRKREDWLFFGEAAQQPKDWPMWRKFMADHGKGLTPEDGGVILITQQVMDHMTMFGAKKVELPEWVRVQHFPPLPDDWGAAVVDTSSAEWPG